MKAYETLINAFGICLLFILLEWFRLWRLNRRPEPMILFCPQCHLQHIDRPEPKEHWDERTKELADELLIKQPMKWTNPPHKTHLCAACGCLWKPAMIPTNGVLHL